MYEQLRKLGIRIGIQYVNGTGVAHYYDHVNDVIVIDVNAEEPDMVSIVHEYVHYLQWHNGYRKLICWELDNIPYNKRSFEYHAEAICTHIDEFTREDGKLNITEILSYYDDIVACFYENK